MQPNILLKDILNKNVYLLIVAAWLFTIAIIIDTYWSASSSVKTAQRQLSNYIQDAETDFQSLVGDGNFIKTIQKENYDEAFLSTLTSKNYFLFLYKTDTSSDNELFFWNTQHVVPSAALWYLEGNSGFVQLQNGYYVWNRLTNGNFKAIALIPVKWNYIITNEYLQNNFVLKNLSDDYSVSIKKNNFPVTSVYGKDLFYLSKSTASEQSRSNLFAVWLSVGGILAILLFIHLAAMLLCGINTTKGILFFISAILILRAVSYFVPLPVNFRQFELFDPSIYGSDLIQRSLGDLLVNAILFVWIILFIRWALQPAGNLLRPATKNARWSFVAAASAVLVLATFSGARIVRSLVSDSQISFDVINFFSLNVYSIVGFIVLCCIAIGYYFLSQIIISLLKPLLPANAYPLFLGVTLCGLLFLSFKVGKMSGGVELLILLWLLLFLFLLNNKWFNLFASQIISSNLVFWLFFFSMSITSLIMIENTAKELRNRRHYAEIISTKADPSSETLINSMLTDFRADYLATNFHKLKAGYTNQAFKDSLVQSNFSGYTDRYDTQIFSFDENERSLFNADSTDYNELNTILNTQARPTGTPNLYFYDVSYDRFSYISKKVLIDYNGVLLGYVFIVANPKRFKNELYPELFGRGQGNSIENSSLYAFAIYNNWKLISSHNDYPFATVINKADFPRQEFLERRNGDYNELWYRSAPDRIVVIAKENNVSIESITLFSYLFCSFLLLTFLFWSVHVFLTARFNLTKIRMYWHLSIRNQIHGTIIFISVLSFFVIGIATILFFISRYENNNREKLSRIIRIMENEVKSSISAGWTISDSLRLETDDGKDLSHTINRISQIHGADVNMYDLQGNLQVSSLALPYIKGITSTMMDPVAYYHLNNKNEIQYFQKERIGKLDYESKYIPVIDDAGNKYAYLNIPYFTSQSKLRDEISNFLVTIINLNAFIFLVAGIVALFITNRITNTFSLIGDKMKKVNLGQRNEAITWTRGDEIGELVVEYNKMVSKLDASAEALARNEREGAWREMAKQIAHEIKNPLTPMKLSMQYLQKSIEQNAPNVKELSANVANTLVEQIDHLSHIASQFSQFANIENSNPEKVNVSDVLKNVLQLYSANDALEISVNLVKSDVFIDADKSHINRIFTNLLQNALQSADGDQQVKIYINQKLVDDHIIISIEDNGTGIDEDIQTKIFTPNFTTKTSGTGLGLAMSKRMTEQAKGEIWFQTSPGKGTVFFLKFPVIK